MKKILHIVLLVAIVGLAIYSTFPDKADAVATDADIPAVKAVALKLADKSILTNKEELKKILSKKTVEFMEATEWKMIDPSGYLIYIDAVPSGNGMVVTMKDQNGLQMPMTFIKEDGEWKVGLFDSLEIETAPIVAASTQKVDLIITKMETSKLPNVLDPKTEFKVIVQNNSEFTAPAAQVDLDIYSARGDRKGISRMTPSLSPGESVVLTFKPFADSTGKLLLEGKVVIAAGSRKVIVRVNSTKKVQESNYTNNTLTKNIVFIRKVIR